MNPIDITEVKPANAKRNEGSLAAQYNVSSDNPDAQIKLQVKSTIPYYTLKGYVLKYEDIKGVIQTIALPEMKPGETYPLLLQNVNARYAFEIFRADGTSVIDY